MSEDILILPQNDLFNSFTSIWFIHNIIIEHQLHAGHCAVRGLEYRDCLSLQ